MRQTNTSRSSSASSGSSSTWSNSLRTCSMCESSSSTFSNSCRVSLPFVLGSVGQSRERWPGNPHFQQPLGLVDESAVHVATGAGIAGFGVGVAEDGVAFEKLFPWVLGARLFWRKGNPGERAKRPQGRELGSKKSRDATFSRRS